MTTNRPRLITRLRQVNVRDQDRYWSAEHPSGPSPARWRLGWRDRSQWGAWSHGLTPATRSIPPRRCHHRLRYHQTCDITWHRYSVVLISKAVSQAKSDLISGNSSGNSDIIDKILWNVFDIVGRNWKLNPQNHRRIAQEMRIIVVFMISYMMSYSKLWYHTWYHAFLKISYCARKAEYMISYMLS